MVSVSDAILLVGLFPSLALCSSKLKNLEQRSLKNYSNVAEVQALQGADERKVVLQLNHHF
jgi:hypothetical protein